MKSLTILGSTGSIGQNTLDVVGRHPDLFKVHALTAYRQIDELAKQCLEFNPRFAVVDRLDDAQKLKDLLSNTKTQVLHGAEALIEVAQDPAVDAVMAAIVGAAGLLPSLAAAKAGKQVLLANKEALVMSGKLFMDAVQQNKAILLPIDSEHNAIYQCLPQLEGGSSYLSNGVEEILLTASGGPFLNTPLEQLKHVSPEEACAHPNWVMGRKISVDSATMMNKGLELIEAHLLFSVPVEKIQVVIHPQSVIHSMVRYIDGSILAQLGQPDMRTPIAYGLAWPNRIDAGVSPLSLAQMRELNFQAPNMDRFPSLGLAIAAARQKGSAPTVLNAANEVAVQAFLECQLSFLGISELVDDVLQSYPSSSVDQIEDVLLADKLARDLAFQKLAKHSKRVV